MAKRAMQLTFFSASESQNCMPTVKTDWLTGECGYPGCMVYFGTTGQLYKTTSFLVVSSSFLHSEMRKSGGNYLSGCSLQLASDTKQERIRTGG